MKIVPLFLISLLVLGSQCTPPTPLPVDYDQKQELLMKNLAPQLVGEWTLTETQVKLLPSYSYAQREANITKDTTFQNVAKLTIKAASNPRITPVQLKNPEFERTIQYKDKTYPIYFYLYASAERLVSNTGPYAFFMLQYDFPSGSSHPTEPEEKYLQNIGLIGDNFGLYLTDGQPKMGWKGLNQGIRQATLIKE